MIFSAARTEAIMNWRSITFLTTLTVLFIVGAASAHHSTAMYDSDHRITINGTVKKFDWTNPHAFIFLEVKDEKTGNMIEWEVEMMSLNHLRSYGWTSK